MSTVSLDSPLVLNPQQAATLRLERTTIEHDAKVVQIQVALVAANGTILERRTVQAGGAAVQTWIANQEATILGRLLATMGVTGTIVP